MSKFLSPDWCNLNWSAWTPFDGGDFKGLSSGAGLYRIRVTDSPVLADIGQTGRDLRQRLGDFLSPPVGRCPEGPSPRTGERPHRWVLRSDADGTGVTVFGWGLSLGRDPGGEGQGHRGQEGQHPPRTKHLDN